MIQFIILLHDLSAYTDKHPVHTYAQDGTYPVTLTVSDGSLSDSDSATVTIKKLSTITGLYISGESAVNENTLSNYTATAIFSDTNSRNFTESVTWSEDSLYTEIDSHGVLSAFDVTNDEIVTITATYNIDGIIETAEMAFF